MMDILALIGAVIAGWFLRGWFDTILLRIGTRIIASSWGKKATLELLAKGIEKL